MIIACGSAVVKQAGLFVIFSYILLYLYYSYKDHLSREKYVKVLILFSLIILVIVLPFYIITKIRIAQGLNTSEVEWVTQGIYGGVGYTGRFLKSLGHIGSFAKVKYLFTVVLFFSLFSIFNKNFRPIFLVFVVPYFFTWSLFFSYDIRNLSIAIPFICISGVAGFEKLFNGFKSILSNKKSAKFFKGYQLIFVFIMVLIALSFNYNSEFLQKEHLKKEYKIGNKNLNLLLYNYYNQSGFNGKILTNYQFLGYLPELKNYYKLFHFENDTNGLEPFRQQLSNDECVYILIPDNAKEIYKKEIEKSISSKKIKVIFHSVNYQFLEINRNNAVKK